MMPTVFQSYDHDIRIIGEGNNGNRPIMYIGGMNSAPSDARELATSLDTQLLYPGDAWYEGREKWEDDVDRHDEWHAEGLADIAFEKNIRGIIAHSRGAVFAFLILDLFRTVGLKEPPLVLLAPPLKDPTLKPCVSRPKGIPALLQSILSPHLHGITETRQTKLIADHVAAYGELCMAIAFRHGVPLKQKGVNPHHYDTTIRPCTRPIHIIASRGDRFFDQSILEEVVAMNEQITAVVLETGSHYPQIENPELVASAIKDARIFDEDSHTREQNSQVSLAHKSLS